MTRPSLKSILVTGGAGFIGSELKPIAYLRLFLSSLSYKRPSKATYALLMLLKTIRPQYIPGLIRISRKISAKMIFKRWKRFSSHFPWTSRGK